MSETDTYELRIQGRLAEGWSAWFDGMEITAAADGSTLIRGQVADQAALHGLIQKVRDLGCRCSPSPTPEPERPHDHPRFGQPEVRRFPRRRPRQLHGRAR